MNMSMATHRLSITTIPLRQSRLFNVDESLPITYAVFGVAAHSYDRKHARSPVPRRVRRARNNPQP